MKSINILLLVTLGISSCGNYAKLSYVKTSDVQNTEINSIKTSHRDITEITTIGNIQNYCKNISEPETNIDTLQKPSKSHSRIEIEKHPIINKINSKISSYIKKPEEKVSPEPDSKQTKKVERKSLAGLILSITALVLAESLFIVIIPALLFHLSFFYILGAYLLTGFFIAALSSLIINRSVKFDDYQTNKSVSRSQLARKINLSALFIFCGIVAIPVLLIIIAVVWFFALAF